jgi:hypothetical protein
MAFVEALPEIAEAAEGGGGLGGMLKDFNDNPVGKIAGSIAGHAVSGAVRGKIDKPQPPGGGGGENPFLGPIGDIRASIA